MEYNCVSAKTLEWHKYGLKQLNNHSMYHSKHYTGLNADPHGGMNSTGNIIRDAWVFGLLPEQEDCKGWTAQGIDALYDKVSMAWEPYGHLASNLPPPLYERHTRIYAAAIERAKQLGWNSELDAENDIY